MTTRAIWLMKPDYHPISYDDLGFRGFQTLGAHGSAVPWFSSITSPVLGGTYKKDCSLRGHREGPVFFPGIPMWGL